MEGPITVVVADDHAIVRAGIETLIDAEPGFAVAGACGSLDQLLALVERTAPHVVLTDIRMPPTRSDEGIRAAVGLRRTHPNVGVVVLSQYLDAAYALELIEGGSSGRGYLLKDNVADPTALFSAIRAVSDGASYIDPVVVDAMFAAKAAAGRSPLTRLTEREGEILAEIATGKTNAAIATALHIGERAVEKHINSIFTKLDLTGDADAHRRVKAVLLFLSER